MPAFSEVDNRGGELVAVDKLPVLWGIELVVVGELLVAPASVEVGTQSLQGVPSRSAPMVIGTGRGVMDDRG